MLIEITASTHRLHVNRNMINVTAINTKKNSLIIIQEVMYVGFIHLGSTVDTDVGTDIDSMARIGKARTTLILFNYIWKSTYI